MTNYNDGKWHGWNGGECPVHPESVVEVFFNRGYMPEGIAGSAFGGDFVSSSICAFRVVKEHKEPREFWMDDEGDFWNAYEHAKAYCDGEPAKFREVIE